ncbi:hypothetical protein Dsin_014679 [Dipteronia sinensis]|uniref:Reverse transcriptase domain-containing protein n=1 Tax=Dipteronia sinensis TaxID=43782 RepID=A0AAE0ANI6_9ROSI|nr:hypothetical protein Dsin_014679 [Dipteronia sinensis]
MRVSWHRPTIRGLTLKTLPESERISLERPFSKDEVWEAVCNCNENKASGPDGLNLNFIKHNWEAVQDDFLGFIHGFHNDGDIVRELKSTFIALIPKCGRPESMKDFRPISLVGSMYKILTKVLANRLKGVMDMISDTQMAFVKNLQILDSYVIAEEIIHSWRMDKNGALLVQLDFEKAYDLVDHDFVDFILSEMGDPVSPFLFNIVLEGLSSLFRKVSDLVLLRGTSFNDNSVHISHLQFADETILFLKPNLEYLLNSKRIFRCFELVAELRINFHKSCVVRVAKKVASDTRWANAFRCRSAELPIIKRKVGLGIGRMLDKNKSLLAKWIWRFGSEDRSLWRKVICAKYGVPNDNLFWDWKGTKASAFVKAVGSLYDHESKTQKFINEGFTVVIGNGKRASFWFDRYGLQMPLREACPRIFALATKKEGSVHEFGSWQGSRWSWEIILRRPPFEWEKDQWRIFSTFLDSIKIRDCNHDTLAWSFCSNGIFSVGSFRRCMEDDESDLNEEHKFIWQGICPLRSRCSSGSCYEGEQWFIRLCKVLDSVLALTYCVLFAILMRSRSIICFYTVVGLMICGLVVWSGGE